MAVTGRDLHQQPVRRAVTSPAVWPQLQVNHEYVRLALIIVVGYLLLTLVSGRGQVFIDDLRYGRPRTTQLSAYVGHNEQAGQPSHFVAMNLNRRVVVIELPGGDSTKAQTLQGPYLFGAKEDLTPVGLRVDDINADTKADLIIAVKNEEIVYINENDAFRLITDDERRALFEAAQ